MTGVLLEVHPRRLRWVAYGAAVLFLAVMVVVAVLLRTVPTGVNFRLADQISLIVLGLVLAAASLMFARPRVRADAAGIEVRNVVLTKHLPWALVLRVSFPDGAPWARLELPDDEYLPMLAIQAADGERAVAAMDALRELHAQYAPPPPVPPS